MRRFYAPPENFSNRTVTLSLEETRHLRDVLRLREGEKVAVFDGSGKEYLSKIETIGKKESALTIIEEISPKSPESNLHLTLAVAILKGEKFDLVIQKAVELGVTRFIPIITKRCDVKLKDTDKKLDRWERIVLESSKQCGRAKLMKIQCPLGFADLFKTSTGVKVLFSEHTGVGFEQLNSTNNLTAIIGSEGGWDESEIELAKENGVQIVTLGGRILRAETAAIAISALLQNHFGDLR